MRYAQIRSMDISNGAGIGVSLFVQGCDLHCEGCFNSETWDFNGGKQFTDKQFEDICKCIEQSYISRFSVLGGEPLNEENRETVNTIIQNIKEKFPHIKIWLWTGQQYEYLKNMNDKILENIFNNIDILVDGPFIQEQKDLSLKYRGSLNQRIINMPQTIKENKIILYK